MLTWISIVIYIITRLPELISAIKKVIDIIKGMPKPQRGAVRELLSEAIEHHKQTKDVSRVKNVCLSVGCGPELVS